MTEPQDTWAKHRPRKGDVLTYSEAPDREPRPRIGKALRIEGTLCWIEYDDGHEPLPFIWCFREGLNIFFDWPSKHGEPPPQEPR